MDRERLRSLLVISQGSCMVYLARLPSLSHTCTYPLSATVCLLYLANIRTSGPALRIYAYAVISRWAVNLSSHEHPWPFKDLKCRATTFRWIGHLAALLSLRCPVSPQRQPLYRTTRGSARLSASLGQKASKYVELRPMTTSI
jgi:hypothetical protein